MSSDEVSVKMLLCERCHETVLNPGGKKFVRCEECGAVNCTSCRAVHMKISCKSYQEERRRKCVKVSVPEPRRDRRQDVADSSSKYGEDSDEALGEDNVCGHEGICLFTCNLPRGATRFRCPWCLTECTITESGRHYKRLSPLAPSRREMEEDMKRYSAWLEQRECSTNRPRYVAPSMNNAEEPTTKPHSSGLEAHKEQPRLSKESKEIRTEMSKFDSQSPLSSPGLCKLNEPRDFHGERIAGSHSSVAREIPQDYRESAREDSQRFLKSCGSQGIAKEAAEHTETVKDSSSRGMDYPLDSRSSDNLSTDRHQQPTIHTASHMTTKQLYEYYSTQNNDKSKRTSLTEPNEGSSVRLSTTDAYTRQREVASDTYNNESETVSIYPSDIRSKLLYEHPGRTEHGKDTYEGYNRPQIKEEPRTEGAERTPEHNVLVFGDSARSFENERQTDVHEQCKRIEEPYSSKAISAVKCTESSRSHAEDPAGASKYSGSNSDPTKRHTDLSKYGIEVTIDYIRRDIPVHRYSTLSKEVPTRESCTNKDAVQDTCQSPSRDVHMAEGEEEPMDVDEQEEGAFSQLDIRKDFCGTPADDHRNRDGSRGHVNQATRQSTEPAQVSEPIRRGGRGHRKIVTGHPSDSEKLPSQLSLVIDGRQEVLVKCQTADCTGCGFVGINQKKFECPVCDWTSVLKGGGAPLAKAECDSDLLEEPSAAPRGNKKNGKGDTSTGAKKSNQWEEVFVRCKTPGCSGYDLVGSYIYKFRCPVCSCHYKVKDCKVPQMPVGTEGYASSAVTPLATSNAKGSQRHPADLQNTEGVPYKCPKEGCTGYGIISSSNLRFECPECGTRLCFNCNGAHGPETCRQYKMRQEGNHHGSGLSHTYAGATKYTDGKSRPYNGRT